MSIELLALRGAMAIGALAAAFAYGVSYSNDRHALKRAEAIEQAREQEEKWQTDVEALAEVKDDEIRRISAARDSAIRELRNRPAERMPETSREACQGGSGAELSGPDAGFLVGEAARANQLRTALSECYGWIDSVDR